MKIRDYYLLGELKNDNSGYARWGFARKDGKEVFIKQFISPIYPLNESIISEKQFQQKVNICVNFERRKRFFYNQLNKCLTGNIVTVTDFFRDGSKYYIVTDKINMKVKKTIEIAVMGMKQKLIIAKVILHCLSSLHKNGIVHNDLKPDNILFKETQRGVLTAKIIDFDSGFLESDPPSLGEDLQGDMIYLSPEAYLFLAEENDVLTRKIDVFAMGIILHQFFSGHIPAFDKEKYDYIFEAVLDGCEPVLDSTIPGYINNLISEMLNKDPEKRPTVEDAFERLDPKPSTENVFEEIYPDSEPAPINPASIKPKNGSDYFHPADDLL